MGMAASQARFLGLTARKSNVEYQGQQINQQRTALSNESANLYNQMMNLEVPTPPSETDYKKTVYTIDNSATAYTSGDYELKNASRILGEANNRYKVTLAYKEETRIPDYNNICYLTEMPSFEIVGTNDSSSGSYTDIEGDNYQATTNL